ncbi:MAG: 3-deoxy-manno-octulosonate cytidylyltransferase, partial [Pseudomonadota bacterium]
EDLVAAMKANPQADIATPVLRCDGRALNGFLDDRRAGRVGGTTAAFGAGNRGLYFSKEVIPYTGQTYGDADETPVFHHVGVYAYRPAALADYPTWPVGPLETLEGLEQLRFLEQGRDVLCVEVEGKGRAFWELNNPEDVPKIEAILRELGIA